ncbi:cyclic nucleotide-binding domain protein (macronuclear) [Tetrahymena thermophila SB210]|uniref:Cyclic nucleotide-binding domain protein n=1 Tax=Tetrahymena thermophila (strain SB210) TaxID=312017 RepID=W7X1V2_TETTS|nr:cyclic nucleotide-binding domain protein [Tetrahymena thermophila SB210]EWS71612.1 cyclic nucleotide-binding domain protein [Tetrahymena thermophila SB210]|eukprot:XP_012655857.1 cyclic nucleotide-binding domain protein [Tetrahymena thermophila SB210]
MSRVNCSPFIKRSNTRQYTQKIRSLTSKIIDENAEIQGQIIDIEEAWISLSKDQSYKTQEDIMKQIDQFSKLKYFKTIIEEGGYELLKQAFVNARAVQTFSDEILFRQGSQADEMLVLLEGKVNLYYIPNIDHLQSAEHESQENLKKKNMLIKTFKAGEAIGNLNLYFNKPFKGMAICQESCKFVSINKYIYTKTLVNADRIFVESQLDFLRSINILSHWNDDKLVEILLLSFIEKVNLYTVIFNQGQISTDFYIVKSGQYGLYQKRTDHFSISSHIPPNFKKPQNNEQIQKENQDQNLLSSYQDEFSQQNHLIYLHEYGPLDHFGQQDIMENKRRAGFVVCKSKDGGELLRIKSYIFIQFILADPITQKLLIQGKIQDQQIYNPQKRLQNFISNQQNIDIDKYCNQIKDLKNHILSDKQQKYHFLNVKIAQNKSFFDNHNHNTTFRGKSINNDHIQDSRSTALTDLTKNGESQSITIHSRNFSLPKISTTNKSYIQQNSLTNIQQKRKLQQNSQSIHSLGNQCQSLNYFFEISPISSPIINVKPSLKSFQELHSPQTPFKKQNDNSMIHLIEKSFHKQKGVRPYRLSEIEL